MKKSYMNPTLKNARSILKRLVFVALFWCVIIPNDVQAQNLISSLSFNNQDLSEVFKTLEKNTNKTFIFNYDDLSGYKVSGDYKNISLEECLKGILKGKPLSFKIDKDLVVISFVNKPNKVAGVVKSSSGDFLPGVVVLLKGTSIGAITEAGGKYILSVPANLATNAIITFSFVGMKDVEVKYTGQQTINITLEDDELKISDVIITGMEVVKKDLMTGSASVLTSKDLKMQGVTSIDRILEGKIAGLNSTSVTGAPGARTKITIRGDNNLSGNTEPLWIVDGLPMLSGVPKSNTGNFAGTIMQDGVGNIMPEDIESISILKDAAATAIYGARAANGVIVITTKKGSRSKTVISYSGSYEVAMAPSADLGFMNSSEKLRYEKSIVDFFGKSAAPLAGRGGYLMRKNYEGSISNSELQRSWNELENTNTDWYKTIFRNSQSHSHNINIRGGSETMTYYTSISFNEKGGILKANKNTNAGILFKLDYRPIKDLIFEINVGANSRNDFNHASEIDPFKYAVFANPYEKPYNADGSYASDLSYLPLNQTAETASGFKYSNFNILRELNENKRQENALDAYLTFRLQYTILDGFTFESIVRKGISYSSSMTEVAPNTYTSYIQEKFARAAYSGAPDFFPSQYDNGSLSEGSGRSNDWSIRNQLNYSLNFKENHLFSVLLATETTSKKTNNFGYTSPIYFPDYRITGVPTFETNPSYEQMRNAVGGMFNTADLQSRSVSFIGSFRYSFKDRYVANFTYRADGADIIGEGNRFTPLWSIGGRYNLHNESWFENNVISRLAIKGSYGYTGNIDRTALPFSTITLGSNAYLGDRFITGFTYPNPTVSWEKKENTNFGVDLSFWQNRINLSADYYSNRTTDVLETLTIPNSTGRSSVRANGGIIENKGVEVYLNVYWINNEDFSFSTALNGAWNKNKIVKSRHNYDSYKEAIKTATSKGGVLNINGEETGSIYGWKQTGVNPNTGNPRYQLSDEGKKEYAKFLDGWDGYSEERKMKYLEMMDEFGVIPDNVDFPSNYKDKGYDQFLLPSMMYLGRTNPLFVGGFSTSLRYKNLEFTTDWTYKLGHLIPAFNDLDNAPNNLGNGAYSSALGVSGTNRKQESLYYWKAKGDVTSVPQFINDSNDYWASYHTSEKYEKGDYLRLTNLSLSYRFPRRITEKCGMNNLVIGFSARNLLTFTKYKGIDVGTQGAFNYPVAREFNFRLTVGF